MNRAKLLMFAALFMACAGFLMLSQTVHADSDERVLSHRRVGLGDRPLKVIVPMFAPTACTTPTRLPTLMWTLAAALLLLSVFAPAFAAQAHPTVTPRRRRWPTRSAWKSAAGVSCRWSR